MIPSLGHDMTAEDAPHGIGSGPNPGAQDRAAMRKRPGPVSFYPDAANIHGLICAS